MAIDYKHELETAAKNMILVHEPDTLIKMIVRMVVMKVQVSYAGILLRSENKDTYILTVSRGALGSKIPAGFARMDADNPIIRYFRKNTSDKNQAMIYAHAQKALQKKPDAPDSQMLRQVLCQMDIFGAEVCIPTYFRDDLLGLLLLGDKKKGREFHKDEIDFLIALASDVAMAIRNAILFRQLQKELDKRQQLFINTTRSLAAAIEAKDNYTHGHTERVMNISLSIARKLQEQRLAAIGEEIIKDLQIAALLHDIGKIGIPESILNKEGQLTTEEWMKMKEHPIIGANILKSISELDNAILGVKHHHERYDGSGYPDRLSGENIPIIAAIISVADSYDAMTTNRSYRQAKSSEEALKEIQKLAGMQFHPLIASTFIQLHKENKI